MKKILIIDDNVWGHHLEYMSHLYHLLPPDGNCELIYVLPKHFSRVQDLVIDEKHAHVTIDYMTDAEYKSYHSENYFLSSWRRCKVLRKYAIKHKVDECFLIMMVMYLPFLPLFLPRGCKVSGIIYRIYYYVYNNLAWIRKMKDISEFWLITIAGNIKRVYVLNAPFAAAYSNRIFHTSKFIYLPDPIHVNKNEQYIDFRKQMQIPEDKCVYLHFGTLTERKGTLTILQALDLMSDEELRKHTYVFAGQIYSDIRTEFYVLTEKLLKRGANIIVYEKFCSFHMLDNLVRMSNVILVPYTNIENSSGIIGYAARFNVPVIGPAQGLLGKLIKKYRLGHTMETITPETLCAELCKGAFSGCCAEEYIRMNTIEKFADTIFNDFNVD